jgi:hypothetical protein
VVALSSCETEYIVASTASTQLLWLVRLLGDLLDRDTRAVELRVDNMSALTLIKNPIFMNRVSTSEWGTTSSKTAWRKGA